MNKIGIITGVAAIAALLPAGIGLAANPSFQAEVPISSVQATRTPAPSTSATSDDGAGHDVGDDHGGDRVRHIAGTPSGAPTTSPDDHGGDRLRNDDDEAGHDVGDDHGGDRVRSSSQDDHGGSGTSGSGHSGSGKSGSGHGGSGEGESGSGGSDRIG